MISPSVNYDPKVRLRKRKEYFPGTRSMQAKPSKVICPISNLPLGTGDERRRYFLVRGKKIAVNFAEFLKYCDKLGWPKPELKESDNFRLESWLADRAKELAKMPISQIRQGLANIAEFASLFGLYVSFIKVVKAAKKES